MRRGSWSTTWLFVFAAVVSGARAEDAPDAFAKALAAPPAEQRKQIRALAVAGDIRAAARMIDLELWDDMKDVPFGTPPIEAWLKTSGEFSGMTAAQVHGCVEQNWAMRQEGRLGDALAGRLVAARQRMESAPVRNPSLAFELAWSWRDFDPTDQAMALSYEDGAVAGLEDPPASQDTLVRATRLAHAVDLRANGTSRLFDVARAADLAERASVAFAKVGDTKRQAWAMWMQAWCIRPDPNEAGDWNRAATLFESSALLWERTGERTSQADSLREAARCMERQDTAGNRARAASLYERVVALRAATGDKAGQADALCSQARCVQPFKKESGDWSRAAALYAQAVVLWEQLGDKRELARSLDGLGDCLRKDRNPAGDWARAIAAYERAARLWDELHLPRYRATSVYSAAWCLTPSTNPAGDWTRAANLYETAGALFAEAGEKSRWAASLHWQADCLEPGHAGGGTWSRAAALYGRAAELYAEAGDESDQAYSLQAQGQCVLPSKDPGGDWERAAALFEQAAALRERLGDKDGQASALGWLGVATVHDDRTRMTEDARAILRRAADLARQAGDADWAKFCESWLK